jgi:NitT/TauT family transport system substrate-binding protein
LEAAVCAMGPERASILVFDGSVDCMLSIRRACTQSWRPASPRGAHENPKAARSLADAYFEALEVIKKDPKKSFAIMGADVKQTADQFEASQKYLRWQDRAANQKFFAGEHARFSREAADVLLEAGIIKQVPDLTRLADTRFIQP